MSVSDARTLPESTTPLNSVAEPGDPRSSTSSASWCSELRWADKDTKCFTAAHYRCLRRQSGLPGVRKVSGRVTQAGDTCSQVRNSRTYPGNEEARSNPISAKHWALRWSGEGPGTSSQVKDQPSKTLTKNLLLAKVSISASAAARCPCEPRITW